MNKHLELVREFRESFSLPQAPYGRRCPVPDMSIVLRQAWLLEAGKQVLLAIRRGDMGEILSGLAGLAYISLNAIAEQGGEVDEQPTYWRHDGSVLSVMRLLTERIAACSSGLPHDYSGLYLAAAQLISSFLNADFDKSLRAFHQYQQDQWAAQGPHAESQGEIDWEKLPDLSDCLYE